MTNDPWHVINRFRNWSVPDDSFAKSAAGFRRGVRIYLKVFIMVGGEGGRGWGECSERRMPELLGGLENRKV